MNGARESVPTEGGSEEEQVNNCLCLSFQNSLESNKKVYHFNVRNFFKAKSHILARWYVCLLRKCVTERKPRYESPSSEGLQLQLCGKTQLLAGGF